MTSAFIKGEIKTECCVNIKMAVSTAKRRPGHVLRALRKSCSAGSTSDSHPLQPHCVNWPATLENKHSMKKAFRKTRRWEKVISSKREKIECIFILRMKRGRGVDHKIVTGPYVRGNVWTRAEGNEHWPGGVGNWVLCRLQMVVGCVGAGDLECVLCRPRKCS